jgi:tripartite-type tricarboxylate transporter receptor subunit TctC
MKNLSFILTTILFVNPSVADVCGKNQVKVVVPAAAGASADYLARKITAQISANNGGAVFVIENKGGAGGTIGVGAVKNDGGSASQPTVLFSQAPEMTLNPSPFITEVKAKYKVADFEPIAYAASSPYVLVCNPGKAAELGIKDIKTFVERAKKGAGLDYGSGGITNFTNLVMLQLGTATGFKINDNSVRHLASKDTTAAFNEILTGQGAPCMFHSYVSVAAHVKSGAVIALGNSSSSSINGIPAIGSVYPNFGKLENWTAFYGKAGIEPSFAACFNKEVTKAMNSPELRAMLFDQQLGGQPANLASQAQFKDFLNTEVDRYAKNIIPLINPAAAKTTAPGSNAAATGRAAAAPAGARP